ncbi:putative HNH homing endonuclease [Aeromonas phage Ahp2]|nr:putative HNH homing endonuclease [Aeromonas phage Ahp2]
MKKPKKMPAKTAVVAISIATGERVSYPTIRQCAELGGFEYSSVRNVLHGRQKSHAGFTFEALTPLRQKKPNGNIVKVAELRNKGLSNNEIAEKLGLKPSTIPFYACQATNMGLTDTYRRVQERLAIKNRITWQPPKI